MGIEPFFCYQRGFQFIINDFYINTLIIPIINILYAEYYKYPVLRGRISFDGGARLRKEFIAHCLPFIEEEIMKRIKNEMPEWIYLWGYSKYKLKSYIAELAKFKKKLRIIPHHS